MPDIKKRIVVKDIKALDKGADLSKKTKDVYVRTKEKAEETQQSQNDTLHSYATNTVSDKAKETAFDAAYKVQNFNRKSLKEVPETIRKANESANIIKKKIHSVTKRKAVKGINKNAQKTIKTAERKAKATIKTSKQTAKATTKTVQAAINSSQKAVQVAKLAAKTAVQAVKITTKAVVATIKAIIASIKGLIALIAAGGWVAVIIILIICMIALIISSPFGIFSGGGANKTPAIHDVVSTINYEWNNKITQIKTDTGEVDETIITINNEVVTTIYITNWVDILSVFSVLINTSDIHTNAVEMDANRISKLKEVFHNMNTVTNKTEQVEIDDKTITRLIIEIKSKSYLDMIPVYNFNPEQRTYLNELMSEKNKSMFDTIINN